MTLMKANIENFVSGLGDGEKYVFFFHLIQPCGGVTQKIMEQMGNIMN